MWRETQLGKERERERKLERWQRKEGLQVGLTRVMQRTDNEGL